MVAEGNKEYSYSGLDKVESIREDGNLIASYSYHTDGQLAQANYNGKSEKFTWDGLALMARNEVGYLNEPSVTGGNPISANGKTMFNDMLGSTLGVSNGKSFDRATMTSFGAYGTSESFYTGKPQVDGLGYTFNYRNYRADQGKWSTADPTGYPDGFNNYAYVNNGVTSAIDYLGQNIIHLVDPNGAVFSAGHSAWLVGNKYDGYYTYDYSPAGSSSGSGSNSSAGSIEVRWFQSVDVAIGYMNSTREEGHAYTEIQYYECDSAMDELARTRANQYMQEDYDLWLHNCYQSGVEMFEAMGVPDDISSNIIHNAAFDANNNSDNFVNE